VKIAVVVQRYGQAINGGAELHARYIAEHLARHVTVEVLTTCANDYVTWRNELAPGLDSVGGLQVRRFRVRRERDPRLFGRRSDRVFEQTHSLADELAWIDAEGPTSPDLIDYIARHAADYDYLLFFSYRYYHAYHGIRAAAPRAILVPTAERDAAIGLSLFRPIFRGVRALMYNSHEERTMIQAAADNGDIPGVVVGIGSDIPQNPQPARFRQKYNIEGPFAVYVGRIDKNKGCPELFEYFLGYLQDPAGRLSLVLIGNSILPVPSHPRIRHVGFVSDADKFDAMAAAELLIMPSYFESLSMVTLEAWALGRPVLVNGHCDVLKGQSIRSNAGLYYETYAEFRETLHALEENRWVGEALGRNGRHYFREHYDWPIVERKYLDVFRQLSDAPAGPGIEPLPGWLDRRHRVLPPGEDVLAQLPKGPTATERHERSAPPANVSPAAAAEVIAGGSGDRAGRDERSTGPAWRPSNRRRGYNRSRRIGSPSR
jgi:glycosyltransferase involved in cell wall biosynthesis